MDFTFLTPSGAVAFFRSDAEQAEWTEEEMSLLCTFPVIEGKMIERGMIVLFQDPATDDWQAFEVRNDKFIEGDHYQQFTAESIAISELTDCHIRDDIELTDVSPQAALAQILEGTGWNVGEVQVTGVSSGDLYRGSVWNAVGNIKSNWNCYIEPRVTVNANGIAARYLDIFSPDGAWRGLRLAINKNISDISVTYDDSELYTAFYGYGSMYTEEPEDEEEEDQSEQLTTVFDFITWEKTDAHPAKPYGQGYIEDPEKTALYGRNGKPRFGYYQNSDIKDPELLLEKTWESLKQHYEPKISIAGTVTDLYRLGYKDQPLRLHDMVIVEVEPIGVLLYRQIIRLTVNLLDPTGNRPEIGDYIPNIIYINRETEDYATDGAKSNGGGGSRRKKKDSEFKTSIEQDERNIHLNAQHIDNHGNILQQAGMFIDPITGVLIYAEDNERNIGSKFRVQSDRITAEVTERKAQGDVLSSRITQESNRITLEVTERKAQGDALSSRITITAREIRSEVSDSENRLNSRITQTATEIRSEVSASEAGLQSQITQTATEIRSEVSASEAGLQSQITQNASSITAEVTRATGAESGLSGRITINSNKVSLVVTEKEGQNVVNAASIVAGINDQDKTSSSYVDISADYINLSGYVTASQLNATNATITNLTNGTTTAASIKTNQLAASSGFSLGGHAHHNSNITIGGVTYNIVTWA